MKTSNKQNGEDTPDYESLLSLRESLAQSLAKQYDETDFVRMNLAAMAAYNLHRDAALLTELKNKLYRPYEATIQKRYHHNAALLETWLPIAGGGGQTWPNCSPLGKHYRSKFFLSPPNFRCCMTKNKPNFA